MSNLDTARGLAYGLLFTWTHVTHELSEALFRGKEDAAGLLNVMRDCVDFVEHNTAILTPNMDDFKSLCEELNKEDN